MGGAVKVRALNSSGASEGGLKSIFIRSFATSNPVNPPAIPERQCNQRHVTARLALDIRVTALTILESSGQHVCANKYVTDSYYYFQLFMLKRHCSQDCLHQSVLPACQTSALYCTLASYVQKLCANTVALNHHHYTACGVFSWQHQRNACWPDQRNLIRVTILCCNNNNNNNNADSVQCVSIMRNCC